MNTRHLNFTPVIFALLAALVASLVWQSASAQAVPPINSRAVSNLTVPIAGTVQVGAENIALSGRAHIMSTMVTDPDFRGPPSVILSIDLLNVSGVGQTTRARYVARGEDRVIRLLVPTDLIEITFPVFAASSTATALARPALVSITLDFDVGNGHLRRAVANFATADAAAFAPVNRATENAVRCTPAGFLTCAP